MSEWTRTVVLRQVGLNLLIAGAALTGLSCGGEGLEPPTTGNLKINTATSGPEPDADGYDINIDQGTETAIAVNATMQRDALEPGSHSVQLGGLAANCTLAGENPRTVSVTAGETATVSFAVTCNATTGALKITSSTSGPSPDADGYSITLDGSDRGPLGPTAEVTLEGLAPGDRQVGLSGVAANCQIQGDNLRAVTITAGATASVVYTIGCATPPPGAGSVRITTATSGPDADPNGYTLAVDGGASQPIAVNATTILTNLAPGVHSVQLGGVAGNCTVQGTNPRSVTVTGGATADLSFVITCSATTGTIRVSVTTSGSPTDPDGYVAKLDGANPGESIATGGTVSFTSVPAGSHRVALTGVAANCSVTGGPSRDVTVAVGATADLSFVVTCAATTGGIRVTTATTGLSLDSDGYTVSVDGATPQAIGVNADLTISSVAAGDRSVTLAGAASNCTIAGTNPRTVAVAAGSQSSVTFTVTCTAAWQSIPLPTGFVASALWASSLSDLFVVGFIPTPPVTARSVVLHYDGHDWTEQFRSEYEFGGPQAIWGSSPTNVFAAGVEQVWQYDGTGWLPLHTSVEVSTYRAIWGTSPQDLFVVGTLERSPNTGLVDHYDGAIWSYTDGGFPGYGEILDISGSSPTDVYVVGTQSSTAEFPPELEYSSSQVAHYDGHEWSTSFSITTPPVSPGISLTGVWAYARNDVFVVGSGGHIFHFDGVAWSPMTSPTPQPLLDVWGNASSNVYAVGDAGVLRYDGTKWSVINTTPGSQVWGAGADVFVISEGGILHSTP